MAARPGSRATDPAFRRRRGAGDPRDDPRFPPAGASGRRTAGERGPERTPCRESADRADFPGRPGAGGGDRPRRLPRRLELQTAAAARVAGRGPPLIPPESPMSFPFPPMLAAVAPVEDLPADAPQVLPTEAAAAAVDAGGQGISYVQLLIDASLPVQVIMLLLALGSIVSWVIIFRKQRAFTAANDEADDFESRFWSGVDLTQLYRAATDRNRVVSGLEAIFEAGFREFARLRQKKG